MKRLPPAEEVYILRTLDTTSAADQARALGRTLYHVQQVRARLASTQAPGCRITGCHKPVFVKQDGLCKKHYTRKRRHGDPTITLYLLRKRRHGDPTITLYLLHKPRGPKRVLYE